MSPPISPAIGTNHTHFKNEQIYILKVFNYYLSFIMICAFNPFLLYLLFIVQHNKIIKDMPLNEQVGKKNITK